MCRLELPNGNKRMETFLKRLLVRVFCDNVINNDIAKSGGYCESLDLISLI